MPKLNKLKSVAVTDNLFLCSIVFHKIDIPELATDVSKLILSKKDEKCKDILHVVCDKEDEREK